MNSDLNLDLSLSFFERIAVLCDMRDSHNPLRFSLRAAIYRYRSMV